VCTVTCIGIESGQIVWRAKPILEHTGSEMELMYSPFGDSILVACKLEGRCFDRANDRQDVYQGIVVCLNAERGNLVKKACIELPGSIALVALKYVAESEVIFAVDAWEDGQTVLKVYRSPLSGPPPDWKSHQHGWYDEEQWPVPAAHQLLWMRTIPDIKSNLSKVAFKPVMHMQYPSATMDSMQQGHAGLATERIHIQWEVSDEQMHCSDGIQMQKDDDVGVEPASSSSKRKSHRQRQRKKKWRSSIQVPTPASND